MDKENSKWQMKFIFLVNDEIIVCKKKETAELIAESLKDKGLACPMIGSMEKLKNN